MADDREQGILVELDKKRRESEEVTEEEIIVVERDLKGKLTRKKPKVEERKRSESQERVEIEEIEEDKVHKVRKSLKPKKPKTGEDNVEIEEIEELETIEDVAVPSVPLLNVSSQRHQIVALTTTVDQAPGVPESEVAKVTLDTVIALTEEYRPIQESEIDQVLVVKPDTRIASVAISPMEPYSTMETTIQISTGEFQDKFKPQTFEATRNIVPKEGVQVSETLPSEAKPSSMIPDQPGATQRAEMTMTLREATTISETTAEQSEVPTEDFVKPATVTAEDSVLPKVGLSVYEVHEGESEDKLEPLKTIPAKPRINVTATEPLTIEEVQTEDKPGKYYPELIVPTEVAMETMISQHLLVTEEMHAAEKEGQYVPGRLPAGQWAQVGISESGEVPEIGDQPVQEMIGVYTPDRKLDTFEAERNITVLESFSVSTVDTQHQESTLVVENTKSATAELNIVEKTSVLTIETITSERETEYKLEERPTEKVADSLILPLEIGCTASTMVQESEGIYNEETKPTSVIAEMSMRPEEYVMVSQIQTADYPSDFREDLKYVTESGSIIVELTEAKIVQETLTHDREENIKEEVQPETRTVETTYDSVKGIEVFQTTSVDKEGKLKIFELPESHRGKTVPTQPVQSFQIEETRPEDNLGDLDGLQPLTATAKIQHDNFQETIVNVTVTDELVGFVEKIKAPDSKVAKVGMDEIETVSTTEVGVHEMEGEYTGVSKMESQFATTVFTTRVAFEQREVRTESPTGELPDDALLISTAESTRVPLESVAIDVQEIVEKEGVYSEDIKPEEKIANVEYTEARPGATALEVLAHDLENTYSPDTMPQNFTALSTIDSHTIATKSEIVVEQSAGKMEDDKPKTAKAFGTQEALDELVIVETNVAETERPRLEETKPLKQSAEVEVTAAENITITEVVAQQKEEILQPDELASGHKLTMNLTSSHEVAQTRETVVASNVDVLANDVRPKEESATLLQNGLEIVQQTETSTSEMESILPDDLKPESKRIGVTFAEGECLQVTMIHPQDKEGLLDEKVKPKSVEASIDFEVQGVASKFEIISDTDVTAFSSEVPNDAKPQTTLLPYETFISEEVQTRETEAPFAEFAPSDRKAELAFEMGESVIVSTVTIGDTEKILEAAKKPEGRIATFEVTTHGVAQSSEIIPEYGAGEFKPEVAQPATASTDHVTHTSLITSETSPSDLEGIMSEFVKPEEKVSDVAFEEASLSLNVTQTITSDKEKDYIPEEFMSQSEHATASFDAHRVAELTEVTTSLETRELTRKVPDSFVAKREHLTFESSVIQTEAVVSENETEFTEKPVVAKNTASITIGDEGNVTTVTEVTTIDKESELIMPEKPAEKTAIVDLSGHVIAEMTEVEVDSAGGPLEELKPQSAEAVSSQMPMEGIVRTETQATEAEVPLKHDQKPTEASADLSIVEGQSLQVSMVTIEDKESVCKPKHLPETRTADKVLDGGHFVAQIMEHVIDSSTKELVEDKPTISTAELEQIPFNPVTSCQMIVGESEDQLLPDIKPEDKVAIIDVELGRSTVMISEITPGDKESIYSPEILPGKKLASLGIDSTHEIAETSSVVVEDALGNVERVKLETMTASSSQEVYRSVIVSQDITQDREKSFEGTFKPETRDAQITIEEGKRVMTITETRAEDREETFVDEFKQKGREAVPEVVSGHEVAEKSEVIPSLGIGKVDIIKPVTATAQIGQKPFETVQLTEEFLGEKEEERINKTTVTTRARVALDEERSVLIVETTAAQDVESELATPLKPREQIAEPAVEGKEVAQQSEVTLREDVAEIAILKPSQAEAKGTQGTFESVKVTEAIPEELGTVFTGKFEPNKRSADVAFVEGKSVIVNEVIVQDKEGTIMITSHAESTAELILTKVGQDVAQKTEVFIDQSVGSVAPFESDQRKAHPQQDTFEPVIIEEVPTGESEGSFIHYPKSISTKAHPIFEEGHSVTITEVTSGEAESTLEHQKIAESRTAERSFIIERSVETTMVDSQVNVPDKCRKLTFDEQIAISSQDTFESVTVSESLVQEGEQPFEGAFKPAIQKATIDVQGVTSIQVSEIVTEDKEESFEGAPKRQTVQATSEYNVFESVEKSEIETVHSIGEVSEAKHVTSQATLTQTTMDSVVKTVTTTAERENTFEEKFKPEEHKGIPHMDGLSTVIIQEVISNEAEDVLAETEKPKHRKALFNISGREVAQTTEVETVSDAEEFNKFAGPAAQEGKPQVDELTSVIVSLTVSNEAEEILESPEAPQERNVQPNLDGREIAEIIEVETISTIEELIKAKGPDEQTGTPTLEEHSSVTVSQVVSNETEEDMPSLEIPGMKTAQPNLLGREIAETTQVESLSMTEELADVEGPEKRRGQPGLEELSSIIVSQTVSNEVEELLPEQEVPDSKTAESYLSGRHVAETSQVLTLSTFQELAKDTNPEKQQGKPVLEEHSSVTVSQIISHENEDTLPSPEVPKGKTAQPNLSAREIAESSQVITLNIAEDFAAMRAPEGQRGKTQLDELTSLIISQTISNEAEENLPIAEAPNEVTAKSNLLGRETAETIQVTTVTNAEELLAATAPEEQKGIPQLDELMSLIVSQALTNEAENVLLSPELPTIKTATSNIFGREIAETTQVTTVSNVENFVKPKEPEEQRGKPQLDELTSVIVSQTVSNEVEENLPSAQIPSEFTAKPNLSGRETAETIQVMTVTNAEDLPASEAPESHKGTPSLDELTSLIVSQPVSNEAEDVLTSPEVPPRKTATSNFSGHEIAETTQVLTVSSTEEFVKPKVPEQQRGKPQLDELTSLIVSQPLSNEAEELFLGQEIPSQKTAQPLLSGRDVAEISQVMALTSTSELITDKRPGEQEGKPNVEEFSSLKVSQVVSNEREELLPSQEVPNQSIATANLSGREAAETIQVMTLSSADELLKLKAPEEQTGKPVLEEFVSLNISQINANEAEDVLPSPDVPTKKTAQSNLFGREVAEKSEIVTVTNAEQLPKDEKPEGQRGIAEVEEMSMLTVSEVVSNETEKYLPADEKPKEHEALPHVSSIEVVETIEIMTVVHSEDLPEQTAPESHRGKPNLEEFASLFISEVTEGETEDILATPDEPIKQIAGTLFSGRQVAEKSQVLTSTTTEELPAVQRPESKHILPKQIPYETFEQSILQLQESEAELAPSKKAPSGQADIIFQTLESLKVSEVTNFEKESKEVIKGKADEVSAQPEVVDRGVALKEEVLPETVASEFDVEKPETKRAREIDEDRRNIIVTQLETTGERESELPESVKPFTKVASVLIETDHLQEVIVGKYNTI